MPQAKLKQNKSKAEANDKQNASEKEKEKENECYVSHEDKSPRFTPPTVEEVAAYCKERTKRVCGIKAIARRWGTPVFPLPPYSIDALTGYFYSAAYPLYPSHAKLLPHEPGIIARSMLRHVSFVSIWVVVYHFVTILTDERRIAMPREHEAYRDNLEELLKFFGNKRLVTAVDVARYCGRDYRFVANLYNIPKTGITLPTLARRMCK